MTAKDAAEKAKDAAEKAKDAAEKGSPGMINYNGLGFKFSTLFVKLDYIWRGVVWETVHYSIFREKFLFEEDFYEKLRAFLYYKLRSVVEKTQKTQKPQKVNWVS
jgi:hypothetical protein